MVEWFGRLHGHSKDDAFPALPKRSTQPPDVTDFLADDEVPSTLKPLFDSMFSEQVAAAAFRCITDRGVVGSGLSSRSFR